MIDSNELLFVVDDNNNPLKPQPRHFVHKNGIWHRTAGIWVINNKRQILCQKRSLKKDINPGFWETFFGGHVAPNKNYFESAVQECNEELGIKIKEEMLIPYEILKSDKSTHKEFQYIFALKSNQVAREFEIEKEEIDEIKWFDYDEIKKILITKPAPNWVHKPWDQEILSWLETIKN